MTVAPAPVPATVRRTLPVVVSSNDDTSMPALSWVYAHGSLEARMGWDCLCGTLTIKAGVTPCVFADDDGMVSCIAFMWADKDMPRMCGMVVAADDTDALAHAMRKMLEGSGC